jgi:hypothetical protein
LEGWIEFDGGLELFAGLGVVVGLEEDAAEDSVGVGCKFWLVGVGCDDAGGEELGVVEITGVEGDVSVLDLHGGEIGDEGEGGVEVVGCLVVLAGAGVAEGELAERVGDEDAVLLGGVVEVVGCLKFLGGVVAALEDRVVLMGSGLLCAEGKGQGEGQKSDPGGGLRATLGGGHGSSSQENSETYKS